MLINGTANARVKLSYNILILSTIICVIERASQQSERSWSPNCLIKNLSEMTCLDWLNGRQSGVNDGQQESSKQGVFKPIPEGCQEGEGTDAGRGRCIDWVQPLVWGWTKNSTFLRIHFMTLHTVIP